MNKHTPGPWHVIERANGQAFSIGCQVQTKGNFITTRYIANVTDGATPQAEADARLIAAAPEMLKALEMVVAWDDDPVGNALDIGAIKAAIKASKGEV